MQLRNTMILVLVVWLLVGWVRSQHDATASSERARRAHFKKRILERLVERGIKVSELENLAEELLARVDHHLATTTNHHLDTTTNHHLATTTNHHLATTDYHHLVGTTQTSQPFRHKRDHLNSQPREPHLQHSVNRTPSQLIRERPSFAEIQAYAEVYPELKEVVDNHRQEVTKIEEIIEEVDDKQVTRAMEQQLFVAELVEQMRDKRQTPLTSREVRNRDRRRRRQEQRQERQRKREEKKSKRNKKKKKRAKFDPKVENMIDQDVITVYGEGGEKYIDCCPSKSVIVKKIVGKADDNHAMEIHANHQHFYERVCLDEYLGKECIFPVKALRKGTVTRCVQQYSYSQALSRTYQSDEEWKMNNVEVKTGCACQVSVKRRNKKRKRKR
ncbi:hypothetical protein OTU49_017503 [Cherax quadricarinatus]|uniref:Spaetzle domain-containing protein n=1 Tax=Cherax quadricarinatus TaxID=27406 RepID=A0AAW0YIA2_CHEQU|nr:uncharacterized protein LOC128691847 [Cherax quadricarinatus]